MELQTKVKKRTAPIHFSIIPSKTRSLDNQADINIVVGRLRAKDTIFNHFFSTITKNLFYLFLAILLL